MSTDIELGQSICKILKMCIFVRLYVSKSDIETLHFTEAYLATSLHWSEWRNVLLTYTVFLNGGFFYFPKRTEINEGFLY